MLGNPWDKDDDEESEGSENKKIGVKYERSRDNIENVLEEGTISGETKERQ